MELTKAQQGAMDVINSRVEFINGCDTVLDYVLKKIFGGMAVEDADAYASRLRITTATETSNNPWWVRTFNSEKGGTFEILTSEVGTSTLAALERKGLIELRRANFMNIVTVK